MRTPQQEGCWGVLFVRAHTRTKNSFHRDCESEYIYYLHGLKYFYIQAKFCLETSWKTF